MRGWGLAAASVALLACLGACSDESDSAAVETASVEPTPTPVPTPSDPFGWTDVEYEDYLAAGKELGLRPDVLVPRAGFSSGLNTLCRSSAEELAALRTSHAAYTKDSETYATAKYLSEEVGLRIGLACPQRMGDWTEVAMEDESDSEVDEENSTVTDEDLARATEEEAKNDGHSYDSDGSGHGSYGHGHSDDNSDKETDEESGERTPTGSSGSSSANGAAQN